MNTDKDNQGGGGKGKRPDQAAITTMLQTPHHGKSGDLAPADPISTTPMVLPLAQIDLYDNNPRSAANAMYDDIKTSIEANGLHQPLVITRRPGEANYMIRAGGNTRLAVVKDLYANNNDSRFAQVNCVFEPWVSESDTLTAHLIENDTRGDLIFIDRAKAVAQLKQLLEEESGKALSQRELSKVLAEQGYRISHSLISQMNYALETLLPAMPTALNTGLGKHQIEKLRSLDKAGRNVWLHHSATDNDTGYEVLWAGVLSDSDGDDWQYDACRRQLEVMLAEACDQPASQIKLDLNTALAGRSLADNRDDGSVTGTTGDDGQRDANTVDWVDDAASKGVNDTQTPADPATIHTHQPDNDLDEGAGNTDPTWPPVVDDDEDDIPLDDDDSLSGDTGLTPAALMTPITPPSNTRDTGSESVKPRPPVTSTKPLTTELPPDLKSLRGRAYTLAAKIAQRHHISDLLEASPSWGFGYLLKDILTRTPERTTMIRDGHFTAEYFTTVWVWWQLAACAEMTAGEIDAIAERLPGGKLREALETANLGVLEDNGMIMEPGLQGLHLWAQLPPNSLQDLIDLIMTYRAMKDLIDAKGLDVWE